ncbi:MAG: hypothetical protein KDA58_04445 [Planctomycetaceae bacterium]|nr:hypothetical protein [Planctomycetaceae bacterium]
MRSTVVYCGPHELQPALPQLPVAQPPVEQLLVAQPPHALPHEVQAVAQGCGQQWRRTWQRR